MAEVTVGGWGRISRAAWRQMAVRSPPVERVPPIFWNGFCIILTEIKEMISGANQGSCANLQIMDQGHMILI